MKAPDAADLLTHLCNLWPTPVMKSGEAGEWTKVLSLLDEKLAYRAVDKLRDEMTDGKPRLRRPLLSEFLAVQRGMAHRAEWRAVPNEPIVSKARNAWWVDQCRRILRGQDGPDHSTWDAFEATYVDDGTPRQQQMASLLEEMF